MHKHEIVTGLAGSLVAVVSALLVMAAMPDVASAHGDASLAPRDVPTSWTLDWTVIATLCALCIVGAWRLEIETDYIRLNLQRAEADAARAAAAEKDASADLGRKKEGATRWY